MPSAGGKQLINGQEYVIGTPEWQKAREGDTVRQAGISGTAAGTEEANKITAVSPALQGLFGAINGSGGSGSGFSGGGGGLPPGGGAPAGPSGVAPVDTSAAVSAEFANAKDQVGQETGGALTGLRAALAGRGMLGSGAESRGTTSIVTKGQGELGKVSRSQAIEGADLEQKNAETNYRGQVAQRGQDIQRESNVMQANHAQAQLQLQQRQMQLNALQAALSGSVQSY